MKINVKISNNLLCLVEDLPSELVVEKQEPVTIGQLASELKIPAVLIVIAAVDGVKRPLDFLLTKSTEINFIGPMAGG